MESKQPQVGGVKRSRSQMNNGSSLKNISIDVILVNTYYEKYNTNNITTSSSDSIKEEKEFKKEVGFK
jgi:hypothetical protein